MTNEVACAAGTAANGTNGLADVLNAQLTQGQELWNQILTWISERGFTFAVNLLTALLILLVGAFLIKLIRGATAKALGKVNKMSKLLSDFLVSVVSKTCWVVLALVVLQRLGVNVGPLVAGLGVTGFILGFALQETLGSFAAGIMIALNQPFKVGDYVEAAGAEGLDPRNEGLLHDVVEQFRREPRHFRFAEAVQEAMHHRGVEPDELRPADGVRARREVAKEVRGGFGGFPVDWKKVVSHACVRQSFGGNGQNLTAEGKKTRRTRRTRKTGGRELSCVSFLACASFLIPSSTRALVQCCAQFVRFPL